MIYDRIENIALYGFDKMVTDFIRSLSSDTECKKYILNDDVYVNVEEYTTKELGYFESHRKYLDIQILLDGEEIIEYTPVSGLTIKDEYDESRDIEFFSDGKNTITPLKLDTTMFAVFYPQDAHKPQLKFQNCQKVKKAVVKIKV